MLLLAVRGSGPPLLRPLPYFDDGRGLWLLPPADAALRRALASPGEVAALLLGSGDDVAQVLRGRPRLFSLSDPVGLVTHGPVAATALAAMVATRPGLLRGHAAPVVRALSAGTVAVHVAVEHRATVRYPDPAPGIAPALPDAVPADVRRAVAGERRVSVAADLGDALALLPALWSAGMALTLPAGVRPLPDAPATVAVHHGEDGGCGVSLHGRLRDSALVVEHATWWRGGEVDTAAVPASPPGGIEIPD